MFDEGWEDGPGRAPTWSRTPPGAELAAALEAHEPVGVGVDGGFDAAERLGAWEALAAWATARGLRESAEYLAARQARVRQCSRDLDDERLCVAMELATYTRVAPRTGEHRLESACALVERLPRTLAALEDGRIGFGHARVILEQTSACDDAAARRVDAAIWDRPAREQTPTQLRDSVRRIIARLDPEHLRRRVQAAVRERGVRYWADDDGATGVVQLRLPAPEACGVYAVVDHLARRAGDPPGAGSRDAESPGAGSEAGRASEHRTLDNKRADVMRDLILDQALTGQAGLDGDGQAGCGSTDGETAEPGVVPAGVAEPGVAEPGVAEPGVAEPGVAEPGAGGLASVTPIGAAGHGARDRVPSVRTEVRVTVPWHTLAGLSDEPGELEGHGPIPADHARAMAMGADAIWLRLLTDPVTGTTAHLDRRRYRPPRRLADFVRARDQTCAAPGCRVPAARCDLDHVIPYDHAVPYDHGAHQAERGSTCASNLRPACRRHHRVKTHAGWRCATVADPTGASAPALRWTSPTGRAWLVRAPEIDPPPWTMRDPVTPRAAA